MSMSLDELEKELAEPAAKGAASARPLPDIEDAFALLAREVPEPAVLVEGLLHQGSKLVMGGSSKSNKTWCLADLALSVAFGEPWLSCKTTKGRVLYVNLEIQEAFFRKRLDAVARAKGICLHAGQLDVWNLRGHSAPHSALLTKIREGARSKGYSLIVLDPIYKAYGSLRENDAGDVALLLNDVEGLAVETGAAVAFGAHYSKGNQAGKESIDRISGSGVFARDPDSILVMTAHEEEACFTVEATLRNFKPLPPFVVKWDYPLMRRNDELDPRKLKQAKGGRKAIYTGERLLTLLGDDALSTQEWRERAQEKMGMGRSKFFELKAELVEAGSVAETGGKWSAVAKGSPESPESPPTD
jgi:hypothetical protein